MRFVAPFWVNQPVEYRTNPQYRGFLKPLEATKFSARVSPWGTHFHHAFFSYLFKNRCPQWSFNRFLAVWFIISWWFKKDNTTPHFSDDVPMLPQGPHRDFPGQNWMTGLLGEVALCCGPIGAARPAPIEAFELSDGGRNAGGEMGGLEWVKVGSKHRLNTGTSSMFEYHRRWLWK